ncbi:MAG TPA: alpha/beta hydrolase [Solirubrobacteraceae bacterium]|nr:alpha/beta hydrolase [Solirubrobacteraceae bacterium]
MEPNPTVDLLQGRISYRDTGAGNTGGGASSGDPIVFVHGLLVDGRLWRKVTPLLESEFRCIVPDLPLGAHTHALRVDADRSPRGVAHLLADFLEQLGLERVTLVANDTGGAIAQLLVTERPERIGRLVLTPCDAYENFLPPVFRPLQWLARVPGALTFVVQGMRLAPLRRSPLGFGLLTKRPIPDEITGAWAGAFLGDAGVRRDAIGLLRGIDKRDTLAAAEKLKTFECPTLLAWAAEDRFFKLRFAERLARDIPNARLEPIADSGTFVSEDQPERLAELIAQFAREPYTATGAGNQSAGSVPGATSPTIGEK